MICFPLNLRTTIVCEYLYFPLKHIICKTANLVTFSTLTFADIYLLLTYLFDIYLYICAVL
jgi:hypothetical protein